MACAVESHQLHPPSGLEAALEDRRYAQQVFMSAPWKAVFHADAERRHSYEEAVSEYEALVGAYERYGYTPVWLPQACVADRVSFVLSTLASLDPHAVQHGGWIRRRR